MRKAWAVLACAGALGCSSNGTTGSDGGGNCTVVDGQCFFAPMHAAARTQCGDVTEYCDSSGKTAPNIACVATPITPPAGPATVALTGFVHVFSAGPDSKGVSIAVYDGAQMLAAGASPSAVTPIATIASVTLDPTTQRACDADAAKGCSIPSKTGCALPICNDGLNGHTDSNMYCRDTGGGNSECSARLRWEARYTISNLPTNKQLVIRVTGPNGNPDQTWATIYSWNVYLSTGDPACAGPSSTDCWDKSDMANLKYQLNVSALSQTDYVNIPTVAGLSGGLPMGQGAIAGEVHDCDNFRVSNLDVGTAPAGTRFTYFNGNPVKTLPDTSRTATDQLGLYAALGLTPGKASVVAAGTLTDGGPLVSFGTFDANVFADSVAVVNINGGKPH
ncbi:MAG TPA: hypothetical protein VFF06_08405 [Polyangia bacterium]|nr:hypothetical protein [Polyangia bacterium]